MRYSRSGDDTPPATVEEEEEQERGLERGAVIPQGHRREPPQSCQRETDGGPLDSTGLGYAHLCGLCACRERAREAEANGHDS